MVAVLHLLSGGIMDPGCPISSLPTTPARQPSGEEGERTRDGTEVQGKVWFEGGHGLDHKAKIVSVPPEAGGDDSELVVHHCCYL